MEVAVMRDIPIDLVKEYASLFVHCWDDYAIQQADGSYWRDVESITLPLLMVHLAGRWIMGSYLLDQQSHCTFAVFDADSEDGLVRLISLVDNFRCEGVPTLLEASRRGGHLWLHFVKVTPAWKVRA